MFEKPIDLEEGHLLLLWVSHVAHVWAAQAERLSVPPVSESQISKVNTSQLPPTG